jgi:HD-like signal output (HDOD) protein
VDRDHRNFTFLEGVYRRSFQAAHLAEALTVAEGLPEILRYNAYTTGMLGEIGIIILAYNMEEEYARIIPMFKDVAAQLQVEKAAFGGTHSEVAAYFLGLWGFPQSTINAVTHLHAPQDDLEQAANMTSVLHVTQALLAADDSAGQAARMDAAYLAKIGWGGRLDQWNAIKKDVLSSDAVKNWSFA